MNKTKDLLVVVLTMIVCSNFSMAQSQFTDSVSYSLGVVLSKSLLDQGFIEVDPNSLAAGVTDNLGGGILSITEEDAIRIVNAYFTNKKREEFQMVIEESEAFLEANSTRSEVTTLPSGLQYEIIKSGDGEHPIPSSRVTVHYEGRLVDGTIFDSSIKRGAPRTFGVTQVMAGWSEALQLMVPGDKWVLYIPSELAYGETGSLPKIQPYAALVLEVELLEIK